VFAFFSEQEVAEARGIDDYRVVFVERGCGDVAFHAWRAEPEVFNLDPLDGLARIREANGQYAFAQNFSLFKFGGPPPVLAGLQSSRRSAKESCARANSAARP
jgi:hypothetical protein